MNPDRLQHILDKAASLRLLVVGDVMLDEFIWGNVSRISPEAPVPVVEVTHETSYPGGAANVARNLREFCSEVHVCGWVGEDAAGKSLTSLLEKEGITTGGMVVSSDYPTIVKTRIVARHQQMVRVDRERRMGLKGATFQQALKKLKPLLEKVDAIIIEDYGKGFISQELVDFLEKEATNKKKVITVDPNPSNPLQWSNVSAVKPNRGEAFNAAHVPMLNPEKDPLKDPALLEVGKKLLSQWKTQLLLVTLGEQGMVLFEQGKPPYHTPTRAREVFDVSGAGDTAISLFTLVLTAGATPAEAAEISNHASGVVVGKLGTATLTRAELIASLTKNHGA
ncbi:MAG: bifunctional ADP-heptose synthase [Chthoniobacterales bacterium]